MPNSNSDRQHPTTENNDNNKGGGGSSYTRVRLALSRPQWAWLEEMVSKHKLPSTSKAIRCCVNCVALGDAAAANDATNDDNDNGWDGSATTIETREVQLSGEQLAWLETRRGVRMRREGNDGEGLLERKLVASCMAQDEYTVFGIVRCKTSIAKCEGAKEAVKNIGERYHRQQEEAVVVKENIDIAPKECGCAGKK